MIFSSSMSFTHLILFSIDWTLFLVVHRRTAEFPHLTVTTSYPPYWTCMSPTISVNVSHQQGAEYDFSSYLSADTKRGVSLTDSFKRRHQPSHVIDPPTHWIEARADWKHTTHGRTSRQATRNRPCLGIVLEPTQATASEPTKSRLTGPVPATISHRKQTQVPFRLEQSPQAQGDTVRHWSAFGPGTLIALQWRIHTSAFLNHWTSGTLLLQVRQIARWIPIISSAVGVHMKMLDKAHSSLHNCLVCSRLIPRTRPCCSRCRLPVHGTNLTLRRTSNLFFPPESRSGRTFRRLPKRHGPVAFWPP